MYLLSAYYVLKRDLGTKGTDSKPKSVLFWCLWSNGEDSQ